MSKNRTYDVWAWNPLKILLGHPHVDVWVSPRAELARGATAGATQKPSPWAATKLVAAQTSIKFADLPGYGVPVAPPDEIPIKLASHC